MSEESDELQEFLLICTIDFNKVAILSKLEKFIENIDSHRQIMAKGEESAFLMDLNNRLGNTVQLKDIYQYSNIFLCIVVLPMPSDKNTEDDAWQKMVVYPMIDAIFEPVYTMYDDDKKPSYAKEHLAPLTWVLAPRENLTKGAFGASGGGSRTVGNTTTGNVGMLSESRLSASN